MLLPILLGLTKVEADAKSSPKQGLEGIENLVEQLELGLRNMETRMQGKKEKLELRLEEREMKMREENEKRQKRRRS